MLSLSKRRQLSAASMDLAYCFKCVSLPSLRVDGMPAGTP